MVRYRSLRKPEPFPLFAAQLRLRRPHDVMNAVHDKFEFVGCPDFACGLRVTGRHACLAALRSQGRHRRLPVVGFHEVGLITGLLQYAFCEGLLERSDDYSVASLAGLSSSPPRSFVCVAAKCPWRSTCSSAYSRQKSAISRRPRWPTAALRGRARFFVAW